MGRSIRTSRDSSLTLGEDEDVRMAWWLGCDAHLQRFDTCGSHERVEGENEEAGCVYSLSGGDWGEGGACLYQDVAEDDT